MVENFEIFEHMLQDSNPYSVLGARGPKNATPIAFSASGGGGNATPTAVWALENRKMQPLLRFRAPGDEKCHPYSVLGPRGPKNATPIAFSGSGELKM